MEEPGLMQRLRSSAWTRLGAVTVVVVLASAGTSFLVQDLAAHGEAPPGVIALFNAHLVLWGAWALWLTVVRRARAFLLQRFEWTLGLRVALEALMLLIFAAGIVPVSWRMMYAMLGPPDLPPGVDLELLRPMMYLRAVMVYALVAMCITAYSNHMQRRDRETEAQERELREQRLEAQLAEARLDALRSQLQPHFLFNALHGIGGLVLDEKNQAAHEAIAALASLLRQCMRHGDGTTVAISEEIELLTEYLALEKIRLDERLRIRIDVDPQAEPCQVPSLLLLPIVENAVKHGIAPCPAGGQIHVRVRREPDAVILEVEDDGVGLEASQTQSSRLEPREGSGLGLANCSERLQTMYGDAASMEVQGGDQGGTLVRMRIPVASSQEVGSDQAVGA